MSGGKLVVKQAYGINGSVKNCFTFSQEHHLAYNCGHQVVILHTETKEQSFIPTTNTYQHQSLGICSITTSLSKKTIAVAEKYEPTAIVTFYDSHSLKKRKVLTNNDLGSSEIKCCAFSEDGKYFLTQGSAPEWNLVLWHVEKSIKILCTLKVSLSEEVHQVSFCPWDSTIILVIGKNILRLYRYIEGQLRPIGLTVRRDQANFISHCWLPDDHLLLGTEGGEILLIEGLEYRGVVYPTIGSEQDEVSAVLCMAPTPRGFIIGSYSGEIKLFERQDDFKEKYQLELNYIIPGELGNNIACVMGSDESIIIATDLHHIITSSFSSINGLKDGSTKDPSVGQTIVAIPGGVALKGTQAMGIFDHLLTFFHAPNSRGDCSITGIDTALWKPIVVTCGRDKSLRVWNLSEKRMELMKRFEDEPLSLSVHPTGMYIVVAFSDKIRMLTVLLEDLFQTREIAARSCSYVKFSRGGQYFASSNGANVQIYNTFTGAAVCTLRGHNNKVRSVVWMNYDSRMMTVGSEGNIYFWDLFPLSRRSEHYNGTVPAWTGTGPVDGSKGYIITTEQVLKEFTFTNPSDGTFKEVGAVKPSKEVELGYQISCVLYDEFRKLLYICTSDEEVPNSIITIMTSPQLSNNLDMNTLHSAPITAICQSYDGSTIFSGDRNGCLLVSEFDPNSIHGKAQTKTREGIVSFEFGEEVIIQKSDLDVRKSQITKLSARVEELNENNDHQLRLKEIEHKEKLKEITEKFSSQLSAERMKYDELEYEKSQIEIDFTKKVKNLESKQSSELKALEMKYKLKQNAEENRHKLLVDEIGDAQMRWNEENQALVESHQRYLQELTLDYEERLFIEQKAQKNIDKQKEELQVKFGGVQGEIEVDGDSEISEMKL
eukprot:gene6512-8950_t